MPIDAELRKNLYNRREWKEAVARIRARGGDRCECRGLCGLLHNLHPSPYITGDGGPNPGGDGRCLAVYSKASPLTVAHVDHDSGELVPDDRLALLCPACHLRYDQRQHQETKLRKERELGERRGQGRLV